MTEQSFIKELTANDTGASGGHQAGIHIPKSQRDLIAFLPPLDPAARNPDAWLECTDESGQLWRFRYVYYNNSRHDPDGTRDEYRMTHMTGYLRAAGARPGDLLAISGVPGSGRLHLKVTSNGEPNAPQRIRLRGWQRVC